MQRRARSTESLGGKILKRCRGFGRGAVFTPRHFLDLGQRRSVDSGLSRLVSAGKIRRVGRGLYEIPRRSRQVGPLWPSIDAVVKAVASRDRIRVQVTGAYAANRLGLSTQVPMRVHFLTDGPNRDIPLGKLTIALRRTTPRNMATAGRVSGLVIQALRWFRRGNVDENMIRTLRASLDARARAQLAADARYAPAWIATIMRHLAEDESL